MRKIIFSIFFSRVGCMLFAQGLILEGTGSFGFRGYSLDGVFLSFDAGPQGTQEEFASLRDTSSKFGYDFDLRFGVTPFRDSNLYFIGELGLLNSFNMEFPEKRTSYGYGDNQVWRSINGEYQIYQNILGVGVMYVLQRDRFSGRFSAVVGGSNGKINIPYKVDDRRVFNSPHNIIANMQEEYDIDSGIAVSTSIGIMPRNGGISIGAKYTFTNNHIPNINKDITTSTFGIFMGYNFIARFDTGQRALQRAVNSVMKDRSISENSRIAVILSIQDPEENTRLTRNIEQALIKRKFQPIDRDRISTAIRRGEIILTDDWAFDISTAPEAGKEVGATHILTGTIQTIDGRRRLNIRVLEAEQGTVLGVDNAYID